MACKSFNTKKQSEELAIGMVAHNEVLEQLGHKVKEEELLSKIEASKVSGFSSLASIVGQLSPWLQLSDSCR